VYRAYDNASIHDVKIERICMTIEQMLNGLHASAAKTNAPKTTKPKAK
jgi:hypothetical protein